MMIINYKPSHVQQESELEIQLIYNLETQILKGD